MITVGVNTDEIRELKRVVNYNSKEFRKQMSVAANKTAAKTKALIAKEIAKQLVVPQKIVKKATSVRKAKKTVSNKAAAIVTQRAFPNGFPLKMLKPVQGPGGVSFKGDGRKTEIRAGAFTGPKPGAIFLKFKGHAFKRVGKSRLPIEKQFGPKAIEIFTDLGTEARAVKFARTELTKQIKERTRFLGLKKSGAI